MLLTTTRELCIEYAAMTTPLMASLVPRQGGSCWVGGLQLASQVDGADAALGAEGREIASIAETDLLTDESSPVMHGRSVLRLCSH
jgi:hypothetical protein